MTKSNRYNIPDPGTDDWHLPLNENWERLIDDVEIRAPESELDEWPPTNGAGFFATDTETLYIGDGEQWQAVESTGKHPRFESISGSVTDGDRVTNLAGNNLSIDAAGNLNAAATGSSGGYGTVVNSIAEAQDAIDNSPGSDQTYENHAVVGTLIVFPPGDFYPSEDDLPLQIHKEMSVIGHGYRHTRIHAPDGYSGPLFEVRGYGRGYQIGHLDFVGDGSVSSDGDEPTPGQKAIDIADHVHSWRLHDLRAARFDTAIDVRNPGSNDNGCWLGILERCLLKYSNTGLQTDHATHSLRIHNCSFGANRGDGARFYRSCGVSVHQSHIENNDGYGLLFERSNGNSVQGCYIEDNRGPAHIGLHPDGSIRGVVSGMEISGNWINLRANETGIQAGVINYVTCENNRFEGDDNTTAFELTESYAEHNFRNSFNHASGITNYEISSY